MNSADTELIASLPTLKLPKLQSLFAEVIGEPTRAPNKAYLIRRITEALQVQAQPGDPDSDPGEPMDEPDSTPAKLTLVPSPDEPTNGLTFAEPDLLVDPPDSPQDREHGPEPRATSDPSLIEPNPETGPTPDEPSSADEVPLSQLSVGQLRERYVKVIGRPTGSHHRRYLIWKIREAQKGRIPTGPRKSRRPDGTAPEVKILPLRMEADHVIRLDQAWQRLGLKSRMDLFRQSLHIYLAQHGEHDVAALFAPEA